MSFSIPPISIREQKVIVNALKNHPEKGIPLLYKKYTPLLTTIIFSIVSDYNVVPDLLQEIFLKIINHINYYNDTKGKFTTWVIRIAKNHCFDYLRSKAYKNTKNTHSLNLISEKDFKYVNNYISLQNDIIDLKAALNLLPKELRTFIIESYFNGLTHQQIAEKYNYPVGTVKSRILKTLALLRKMLNNKRTS